MLWQDDAKLTMNFWMVSNDFFFPEVMYLIKHFYKKNPDNFFSHVMWEKKSIQPFLRIVHSFQVPWQSSKYWSIYACFFKDRLFLDFLIHAVVSALSDVCSLHFKVSCLRVFLQIMEYKTDKGTNDYDHCKRHIVIEENMIIFMKKSGSTMPDCGAYNLSRFHAAGSKKYK